MRDEDDGDEAPDDPGADDLIMGAGRRRPAARRRLARREALETDSFADVGRRRAAARKAFDFDRVEYAAASLAEHLHDQLHGAVGRRSATSRGIIAETLDETGYLDRPAASRSPS